MKYRILPNEQRGYTYYTLERNTLEEQAKQFYSCRDPIKTLPKLGQYVCSIYNTIEHMSNDELLIKLLADKYNLEESDICLEMLDFFEVIKYGKTKHPDVEPGKPNWLQSNGTTCSEKAMHDSMGHHWAQSMVEGDGSKDTDSGLDPLQHLGCRSLMKYTLRKRGIIHEEDKKTS